MKPTLTLLTILLLAVYTAPAAADIRVTLIGVGPLRFDTAPASGDWTTHHNDLIRIFPAVPAAWGYAVFNSLRAEGAFPGSAERRNGKPQWVRAKSLDGEPCQVPCYGKIHDLQLARGEEKLFGDDWKALVTGTTIACAKSCEFSPVTACDFRPTILKANEVPTIEEFQLFEPKKP